MHIIVKHTGKKPLTQDSDITYVLSIAEALQSVAVHDAQHNGEALEQVLIELYPGTYDERVEIRRDNITLKGVVGEKGELPCISQARGAFEAGDDGLSLGTFRTYTMLVDAQNIVLENLVIENRAGHGEVAGQALALYLDGDNNQLINCTLNSYQDTLFIGPLPPKEVKKGGFRGPKRYDPRIVGTHYFKNCTISGTVDFIFGSGRAYFEACTLISRERPDAQGGYICAPSTPQGEQFGFIFNQCELKAETDLVSSVYLARPWRDYGQVAYINCVLGAHIHKRLWDSWIKPNAMAYAQFELIGNYDYPEAESWGRVYSSDSVTSRVELAARLALVDELADKVR